MTGSNKIDSQNIKELHNEEYYVIKLNPFLIPHVRNSIRSCCVNIKLYKLYKHITIGYSAHFVILWLRRPQKHKTSFKTMERLWNRLV